MLFAHILTTSVMLTVIAVFIYGAISLALDAIRGVK